MSRGGAAGAKTDVTRTPDPNDQAKAAPNRAKTIARGLFRFFRITFLVLLLITAVLGFYLNKVGLPEFFKKRVISQARARGLEVQFSRLRLRWYRGIVAEDVQIANTNGLAGPQLFIEEAECPLNPSALKNFKVKMNSLQLRGGRLIWPLRDSGEPERAFLLNDLNAQLLIREEGPWELRSLRSDFHGVKIELTGVLTNASSALQWKIPQPSKKPPVSFETLLGQIETMFHQLKLPGRPGLRVNFQADGKDFSSLSADLSLNVPALDSPWGAATNLLLTCQISPASETNDQASATLKLTADDPRTPWGQAKAANLALELNHLFREAVSPYQSAGENAKLLLLLTGVETGWGGAEYLRVQSKSAASATNAAISQVDLSILGQQIQTEWGKASNAQFTASAWHPLTNWAPDFISADLRLDAVKTRWGDADQARALAQGSLPPPDKIHLLETNLPWAQRLENLQFQANANLTNIHSHDFRMETGSLTVESRWPALRLETAGKFAEGEFMIKGEVNSASRELSFSAFSSVDPGILAPWLSTNIQKWLSNYSFESPPKLRAEGHLILPAWTNRPPDWSDEVMPAISLAGDVELGGGSYRGLSFISAQSPFSLTNRLWQMRQLRVVRSEGALEADYASDLRTRDFHWRGQSQIDLTIAKPFFPDDQARQVFEFFEFTTPPHIQAEIWGNWLDLDRFGLVAQVAVTNVVFRGETVQDCQTRVEYTNKVFSLSDCQAQRAGGERGTASGITIDLRAQKIHFTNGFSTLNPYVVARAIGEAAIDAIAPYQFDSPPTVQVHGALDLKRRRYEEDMHFDIRGKKFHWQQFRLEQLEGRVDWVGQTLGLTNVIGAFRTGGVAGDAHFEFSAHQADFSMKAAVVGADLREISASFSGKTNKLEGLLSGEFVLSHAVAADPKSWQGHGRLDLRDGLIWDIPMFGLFSPVLNAFVPGLGNSRANQATASFILTNGVFSSKDMEIRATMMRMECQVTGALDRRVDARVEAELLRDVPAVGFLISKFFWPVTKLFEYKVTGTLDAPKAEPLYVLPKVLLMPFHPFKTVKEMFLYMEDQKVPNEKKPAPASP